MLNGLFSHKNRYVSFINKGIVTLFLFCLLLAVIVACTYLMSYYWSEMPIFIKIFWPILALIAIVGILLMPLNGMIITKKGTILFLPDFRLKILNKKKLKEIGIVFNEWENNKFSAMVKLVYNDGKIFTKNYAKQFTEIKNNKAAMSMYTIKREKVDKICEKLIDLDCCVISVLDKKGNTLYQNKLYTM